MSVDIFICEHCSRAVFPPRLLCPDCGSPSFRGEPVQEGTLERFGDRGEVKVGMVRVDKGPILIARVVGEPHEGQRVRLGTDGDVPLAIADGTPSAG